MSKAEDYVFNIIMATKPFEVFVRREVVLPDLRRKERLRFDFGLYNSNGDLYALIEYDGEQHFKQVSKFQKTKLDLDKQKEYDRIKNSYALAHNIPLYRIPYTEITSITSLEDIMAAPHRVTSKWHNDYLSLS